MKMAAGRRESTILPVIASTARRPSGRPLRHLEAWIAADAKLIGGGLTIVGQQVRIDDGRLDLLAIDARDRWVVIELKAGRLDSGMLHLLYEHAALGASAPRVRP